MPKRAFLRLAANQVMADIWAAQLRESGYPVDTVQPTYPYPHAGVPVEIWLLDGDILEMPGVRERIEELLGPADPEELPEEFTAEEPPDPPGKLRMWHLFVGAILLLAVWVLGCGRTPEPHYNFLKGTIENPIDAETSRWLTEMRLHGQFFGSKRSYQQILAEARPELEKEGFVLEDQGDSVSFWKDESERYVRRPTEIIAIYPDKYAATKTGSVILWAYRPSNAERIGRALGL